VVGHARTGHEAVRLCTDLHPDVVLMDYAMPELNGLEAIETIRRRSPATRIIMLSMYGDHAHVLRAVRAGAVGYLLKKSVGRELVEAIRNVYVGRTYFTNELATSVLSQLAESPVDPLTRLSARERQVLQLVAEGRTSAEIGVRLSLSPKTVDTYRSRLMTKVGVQDLAGLIKFAIQQGVISVEY
jgi:DNA-binding NarL/FixJ family response regulator